MRRSKDHEEDEKSSRVPIKGEQKKTMTAGIKRSPEGKRGRSILPAGSWVHDRDGKGRKTI